MITLRQIDRYLNEQQHRRLYKELVTGRPEASFPALEPQLARAVPVAALGMIRLDELSQSHAPIYRRLLNVVLTAQQSDGGWGDLMTTAICVRALLCGGGQGAAVERGLAYLASLQKSEGVWPKEPIRRLAADAFTSAFILLQLGSHAEFRRAVHLEDAVDWFAANAKAMDPDAQKLWERAAVRCRVLVDRHNVRSLWIAAADRPAA
jgi:hypothetical protein